MDIRHLRIENFRSLRWVDWEPGPLNILIGPNGSGKSNMLEALKLIRSAASGELRDAVIHKGGVTPLIWSGTAEAGDMIQFSVVSGPIELAGYPSPEAHTYILRLRRLGQTGEFMIDFELLKKYGYEQGVRTGPTYLLERSGANVSLYDKDSKLLQEGSVAQAQIALSLVSDLWRGTVAHEFQRQLQSWAIYGDLRVDEMAAIRQPAVVRVETRVAPDGQNLVPVLYHFYEGEFKRELDKGMSAAFPDDFSEVKFPAAPGEDGRIQLRVRRKHSRREDTAAELSDGTIRFLLLLTILSTPDPPPLIAIDQPEVGLHPSMLPILAEFAVEAARRTQVILTTHSPQLLDAFRDKIPAVTVLTWSGNQTEAKTLAGEELKAWVKDYSLGRFAFSGEAEAVL